MENRKAKGLIMVVLIIILLVCIGVIIWQYKKIDDIISSGDIIDRLDNMQQEQQNVENKKTEDEKNEQIIDKTEKKHKYDKASDLIEDFYHYGNPIEKYINNDQVYTLDMVLPSFKIQTEATKKINEKIEKIYTSYLNDYLSEKITQSSTRNTKISYTADMNYNIGILTLKITIAYTDWAGTGAPNGSDVVTYRYDFVNDKIIE